MAGLKRAGVAVVAGAVLTGIAWLVALISGNDARFYQGCLVITVVAVAAALVMSGSLFFGGTYSSRAATTQLPPPPAERPSDDPVDPETRSRLNSIYPVLAALPSIVVLVAYYL